MIFFDVTAKKAIKQDKVPMHIHRAVLNADGDSFIVAGHGKIVLYEMKG